MRILNLLLVSSTLFLVGVSLSLISPFYPTEALAKGVTVSHTGLVIGTMFITVVLSTPLFGKYIEKLGARRFLILGSFLIGSGNFVFGFLSFVQNTAAFFSLSIIIRFVIALGDSAVGPAAFTLAGKQVGEKHKGRALAGAEASFAVGTMFGPTIGGCLYDLGGFSLPFFVTGIVMMLLSVVSIFCFSDNKSDKKNNDNAKSISWMDLLKTSGVPVGVFSIVFAGIAKRWYAASLGPFLKNMYDLSSSEIGLVFMPFGLAYSLLAPLVGFLTDKGLPGLLTIIIGDSLIAVSLFLIGPVPQLVPLIGHHLWVTVTSIGLQGVGSAFAYIGTLVYMTRQVMVSSLPKSDQAHAMVSSLWLAFECLGCFIGSTLGSFSFDSLGFEMGTLIIASSMCGSVIMVALYFLWFKSNHNQQTEYEVLENEE